MTAAAGVLTGLAKLKRQDSSRSQHRPIPAPLPGLGPQEGAPRKRKRRADVVVVRGRLRLYSASGFFLLLGLLILAMGIGMATLGYWPHGPHGNHTVPLLSMPAENTAAATGAKMASSGDVKGLKMATMGGDEEALIYNSSASNNVPGNSSVAGASRGLLARFLEQHRHSERMKMLGPFTMGIGIFIFICANAILHENRDRETKVIHMRDMYSTVIDIHRLRQREYKHHPYPHRNGSFCVAEAGESGGAARQAGGSSPLVFCHSAGRSSLGGGAGSAEEEAGLLGAEFQEAQRLHPEWPGGQWAVDGEREWGRVGACSIVSSSLSAFTLPVIKLNNCVIDEPEMEAITEEEQQHRAAACGWRDGERGPQRHGERSRHMGGPPSPAMLSLAVPVATVAKASKPPGLQRSHSASSSSSSASLSPAPSSSTSGCWLSPGVARSHQDFGGSNSSLHMLSSHSKSLDLERRQSTLSVHRAEPQRKHPSWPRLDRSSSSGGGGSGGGGSGGGGVNRGSINRGSSKGYARLEDRDEGGERSLLVPTWGEAPAPSLAGGAGPVPPPMTEAAAAAAARRDYSKREKLLMISRSHNNLSFEHDEFNSSALKRGSSETRF